MGSLLQGISIQDFTLGALPHKMSKFTTQSITNGSTLISPVKDTIQLPTHTTLGVIQQRYTEVGIIKNNRVIIDKITVLSTIIFKYVLCTKGSSRL